MLPPHPLSVSLRLGHRRTEDLCPEETALGPLDDLLVDAAGRVVHDDGALARVDLGVEPRVADQVDDPLLAGLVVEAQGLAQALDVDARVDLAVALKDEVPRVVDEAVHAAGQEEVGPQHLLGAAQLALGVLKVKVDEQGAHELGQGVGVLVGLLAHDADNVLELLLLHARVAGAAAAGDDGGDQVAQCPRARGLDGVDVGGGEEEVEEGVAGGVAVEEGEQGPVDEPCALLQLGEGVVEELGVDVLLDLHQLLEGRVPAGGQDLGGELAPCGGRHLVVVGGEDTELVEEVGGPAVVAAAVLEVAEVVKGVNHLDRHLFFVMLSALHRSQKIDHIGLGLARDSGASEATPRWWGDLVPGMASHALCLRTWSARLSARPVSSPKCAKRKDPRKTYIVLLLEELQVGNLVAAQVCDDVFPPQQLLDLACGVLELLQGLDDLLPLVGVLFWWVLQALEVAVEVGDVVGHVGLPQQLVGGLEQLPRLGLVLGHAILVLQLAAAELEEGEDQVPVELGDERRQQVVLGDGGVVLHLVCFLPCRVGRGEGWKKA